MGLDLVIGMVLAFIGYSTINLGLVLEKKGLDNQSKILETGLSSNISNFLNNKTWLLGLLGTVVGTIISYFALMYAPITIVQVFLGVGLCFLAVFSFFILKEKLTLFEVLGIITILIGVGLLSFIAEAFQTTENELELLKTSLNSGRSIVFIAFFSIIQAILWLIGKKQRSTITGISFGLISGISAGLSQILMKGILGGASDFIKSPDEPSYYVWLFLMILFLTVSFITLQMGFQYGAAIHVAPLFNISALVIPVIGGGIIYKEWDALSSGETVIAIISLTIVCIGVFMLSILSNISNSKEEREK